MIILMAFRFDPTQMAEWELFRKDTIGNSGISTAVRDRVSKTMDSFRDTVSKTIFRFRTWWEIQCTHYISKRQGARQNMCQGKCEQNTTYSQTAWTTQSHRSGTLYCTCKQHNLPFQGQCKLYTVLVQKQREQDKVFAQGHCKQENGPWTLSWTVLAWPRSRLLAVWANNVQVQDMMRNTVLVPIIAKGLSARQRMHVF